MLTQQKEAPNLVIILWFCSQRETYMCEKDRFSFRRNTDFYRKYILCLYTDNDHSTVSNTVKLPDCTVV